MALGNYFERGCPSMPVDWSARLDARGYHATSVKRPDTKARWVGATRQSEDDGWTEGYAIIAFDAAGSKELPLKVGDCVYLSSDRKGRPAEIARIQAFYEDPKGDIWMQNIFFWRPERIHVPGAATHLSNLPFEFEQSLSISLCDPPITPFSHVCGCERGR